MLVSLGFGAGNVKHQYVGDISDYRKYALLRALSAGGASRKAAAGGASMSANSACRQKCDRYLKQGLQFGITIAAKGYTLSFRSTVISLVILAKPARSRNMG